MRMMMIALLATAGFGQQLDLSSLERFASQAKGGANVNLDADKLKFAGQFLAQNDKDKSPEAQKFLSSMKGVFVRTFEFDKPGVMANSDLDPIRQQLRAPGWSKLIEVKDDGEAVEVYFFQQGNQPGGMAVLAFEPKEVAVVNLVGAIDLNTLAKMGGSFGIPGNLVPGTAATPKGPRYTPKQKPRDDDN